MPRSTYESEWPRELRRQNTGLPRSPEDAVVNSGLPGQIPTEGLQMGNTVELDALENPASNAEVFQGSLKGLLSRNIGFYIVASFLIGTQGPVSWEGILHSVGNDYIVIYQPDVDRYITGDIYSLKFVEFHNTHSMSPWAGYRRRDSLQSW